MAEGPIFRSGRQRKPGKQVAPGGFAKATRQETVALPLRVGEAACLYLNLKRMGYGSRKVLSGAWLTYRQIAQEVGRPESTVRRWMDRLRRTRAIRWESCRGKGSQ